VSGEHFYQVKCKPAPPPVCPHGQTRLDGLDGPEARRNAGKENLPGFYRVATGPPPYKLHKDGEEDQMSPLPRGKKAPVLRQVLYSRLRRAHIGPKTRAQTRPGIPSSPGVLALSPPKPLCGRGKLFLRGDIELLLQMGVSLPLKVCTSLFWERGCHPLQELRIQALRDRRRRGS